MLDEIENSFWDIINALDSKITQEEKVIKERVDKKQLISLKKINQLENQKQNMLNIRELFHATNIN